MIGLGLVLHALEEGSEKQSLALDCMLSGGGVIFRLGILVHLIYKAERMKQG